MQVNIDVRQGNGKNNGCVYVTIGDWVVYLDNSTGEQIVETINQEEKENV
jgi:hypothetical protein